MNCLLNKKLFVCKIITFLSLFFLINNNLSNKIKYKNANENEFEILSLDDSKYFY